jgi:recombination protein RecT
MTTSTQLIPYKERMTKLTGEINGKGGLLHKTSGYLPSGMDAGRFCRFMLVAVSRNPKLLECDRNSLFRASLQAASLGLELDPGLGQAYLVPFSGIVQFVPGYKGLVDLARRSTLVGAVAMGAVHEGDEFDWDEGTKQFIHHKKSLKEHGAFIAAWSSVEIKGADKQVVVLPKWRVDEIRSMSATGKDTNNKASAWFGHYDAMASKSAIKQQKLIPQCTEFRKAASLDDQAEIGAPQDFDIPEDVTGEEVPPTEKK